MGTHNITGMPEVGQWELDVNDLVFEKEPFAKGAFGRVFKADYLGTPVCVKIISKQVQGEEDYFKFTQREVAALKSLSHPNLVQFIGASETAKEILIITEFVSGGTVRKRLKNLKEEVPWQIRISIALDVASAMAFLHSRHIIHRDLKTKNLLVTEGYRVKLCDFGFARSIKDRRQMKHMTLCGTEEYMAPEVIFGMDYDQRAEVYSFGLLMCELITRFKIEETVPRTPKTNFGLDTTAYKTFVPADCPPAFLAVALKCASYEPQNRPEFRDITKMLRLVKDDYYNKNSNDGSSNIGNTLVTNFNNINNYSNRSDSPILSPTISSPPPNYLNYTNNENNNNNIHNNNSGNNNAFKLSSDDIRSSGEVSANIAPATAAKVASSPTIQVASPAIVAVAASPSPTDESPRINRGGKVPPPVPSRVGRPRLSSIPDPLSPPVSPLTSPTASPTTLVSPRTRTNTGGPGGSRRA